MCSSSIVARVLVGQKWTRPYTAACSVDECVLAHDFLDKLGKRKGSKVTTFRRVLRIPDKRYGRFFLQNFKSRRFQYGYGSVTELPEGPGLVVPAYISRRSSGRGYKTSAVPAPRVSWDGAYRTYRSFGQVQKCYTRTLGIAARSYR